MRLTYLRAGGDSTTLNVGYGHGYSVREVLESVERVSGRRLTVREEPRRAGGPAGAGGPRRAHPERARLAPAPG